MRCSLLPAAAAGGAEGFEALPYLDLTQSPPRHDNEVLRSQGARLLRESLWYPFTVVDAVGGFELLIPQFREALAERLSSPLPLLGVLMSRREALAACRRLGLGERVEQNVQRLWQVLRADPDTRILELSGLSRRKALRDLQLWTEEHAR